MSEGRSSKHTWCREFPYLATQVSFPLGCREATGTQSTCSPTLSPQPKEMLACDRTGSSSQLGDERTRMKIAAAAIPRTKPIAIPMPTRAHRPVSIPKTSLFIRSSAAPSVQQCPSTGTCLVAASRTRSEGGRRVCAAQESRCPGGRSGGVRARGGCGFVFSGCAVDCLRDRGVRLWLRRLGDRFPRVFRCDDPFLGTVDSGRCCDSEPSRCR